MAGLSDILSALPLGGNTASTNGTPVDSGTGGGGLLGGKGYGSGGGGGGSAMDGLNQVDQGSQATRGAIGTAQNALGGNPSGGPTGNGVSSAAYKKGGHVKAAYTGKDGKLNLGSGRISTASKNSKCSNF